MPRLRHPLGHQRDDTNAIDAPPSQPAVSVPIPEPPAIDYNTRQKLTRLAQSCHTRNDKELTPPSPMPSFFNKLPTELINLIVQNVSRPFLDQPPRPDSIPPTYPTQQEAAEALQSLLNLCLTSRLLYYITLPVLYSEFSLGFQDFNGEHLRPEADLRAAMFARTLLERRDLAALVKRAFLHPKLVELMGEDNRTAFCEVSRRMLNVEGFNIEMLFFSLMPNLERLVFIQTWHLPDSSKALAMWKNLKELELVDEYGMDFSSEDLLREYNLQAWACGFLGPGWDDEDDIE